MEYKIKKDADKHQDCKDKQQIQREKQLKKEANIIAIAFSVLGFIMAIVAFFVVLAAHKEEQAMKGITHKSVDAGKQYSIIHFYQRNVNNTKASVLSFDNNVLI